MFRKRKKTNRVLALIDFENLMTNIEISALIVRLDATLDQIAQEVGEIINVIIFIPPHLDFWAKEFYQHGFFTILCPKVKTKETEEKDTVDEGLIKMGEFLTAQIPNITHIALGSGDIDYTLFLKRVRRKGIKRIVIASDLESLSSQLIKLIDKNPDGKRMLYLLSATEGN